LSGAALLAASAGDKPPPYETTGGSGPGRREAWRQAPALRDDREVPGRYGARALEPVSEDLARSARRGEAFVYFNNDVGGHAILDARALRSLLREVAAPLAPRVGSAPGPRAGGTWA